MSKKSKYKSLALHLIFGACVVAGINSCTNAMYSQEDGKEFLEGKGYTQIAGGDDLDAWGSWCGNGTYNREYTVTTTDGESGVEKTVCFSLYGKYEPLL
tara:strand:- start:42 stop:338 length:297 start_codon:yes stop_codon:yes gene_type:complete